MQVPLPRARIARVWMVAALALAAALLMVSSQGSPHRAGSPPAFLEGSLGTPSAPAFPSRATRTLRRSAGDAVTLGARGVNASGTGGGVSLESAAAGDSGWRHYGRGGVRATPFGSEVVALTQAGVEESLVVDTHQGTRTWRWRLGAAGLTPRPAADGSIGFLAGHRVTDVGIASVAILDGRGRRITPRGLRWSVEGGSGGHWLTLTLDDSRLPTPYVIDPAIVLHGTPAGANNGAVATTTLTLNVPSGVALDDTMLAQVSVAGGTATTITPPACGCWTLVRRDDATTNLAQAIYRRTATASEPASYTWTFGANRASGGIIAFQGVDTSSPVDAQSGATDVTNTSLAVAAPSVTTTLANGMLVGFYASRSSSTFTAPSGMSEAWDTTAGSGAGPASEAASVLQVSAGASGAKTATASATGYWVGQLIALAPDTAAPTNALTLSSVSPASSAYLTGSTVYYRGTGGGGGGSFQITDTVADSGSGPASAAFPALGGTTTGWTHTAQTVTTPAGGPYASTNAFTWTEGTTSAPTETVTGADNAGNTATATALTFTNDSTAPTGSLTAPAASATVTGAAVAVSSGSADGGSGVASAAFQRSPAGAGTWTTIATDTSAPYAATWDTTAVGDGLYDLRVVTTDNVGNAFTSATVANVRVDNTAPANALTLSSVSPASSAYLSGTTVYYRGTGGGAGGSFQLTDTVTDAGSGAASATFPALGGTTTGWTHTTQTRSTPAGGPYVTTNAFTWTEGAGSAPTEAVTAADAAGNTAVTTLTFTNDSTAPTGSVSAPAASASVRGAAVAVSSNSADAGAGVASTTFQRSPAGAGTWTTISTDATAPYSVTWDTTAVADGLYDLRVTATDNLGNASTSATVANVRVDNTAPANALTLSSVSPASSAYLTGSTVYYRGTGGGAGGSFQVTDTVTDAGSGPASAAFPALGGTTTGWTHTAQTVSTPAGGPYASTNAFTWAEGTTSAPTETVTGADVAGNTTAATALTFTNDSTAPTGSLTAPASSALLSGAAASLTANSADAGAGVASAAFQRSPAGAGTWTTISTDTAAPYAATWNTTAVADGLYDLRVVTTDNVGNTVTSATVTSVRVDNTAPTGSVTAPSAGSNVRGAAVTVSSDSADAGAGVANTTFQRSPAGANTWTTISTDATAPYAATWDTTAVTDGLYDLRVTTVDALGNTFTSPLVTNVRVDNTNPTGSVTAPASSATVSGAAVAVSSNSADGGSGVADVTFQRSPTGANTWTTIASDTAAPYSVTWDTTVIRDVFYDLRAVTTDNAGNTFTSALATNIKVTDVTAPANVLSLSSQSPAGSSYLSGTTVFYRGTGGGSGGNFQLTNAVVDLGSLPLNSLFPALGGITTGWSHTTQTVSTPANGPFTTTNAFTWTEGTTSSPTEAVKSTDNVTLNTTTTLTFTNDSTAPTGSLTAPAASSNIRQTVAVTSNSADGGSGVANTTFQRSPAGAGTWTTISTDASAPYSINWDTTLVTDGLYDLRVVTADNVGNSFTSATVANVRVDNTAPTGSITTPAAGANLRQTAAFDANSADVGGSGVASVVLQHSPSGAGTWTSVATELFAPYQWSWDTTGVSDGLYDTRVVTTDNAGNTFTSSLVNVRVDNTNPANSLSLSSLSPAGSSYLTGSTLYYRGTGGGSGGSFQITDTVTDGGSGPASAAFPALGGVTTGWTHTAQTVSTPAGGPYATTNAFTWTEGTTSAPTETVTGADNAGNTAATPAITFTNDSTAPTGSLTAPAASSNIRQTVAVTSNSADGGSGVANTTFQRSPAGAGTWTTISTDAVAPYSVNWDTTLVTDGLYDLRVVTADNVGNSFTSATVANVRVDNTNPTGSLTAPAASSNQHGAAVSVTSNSADAGSGVTNAVFQRSPAGAGTWTTISTDTTAPYAATWDTTAVTDGLYDLQVVTTDNAGNTFTSPVIANVRVDNTNPTGSITTPASSANMRGTAFPFAADSADAGSGVASAVFQGSPAGANSWTTVNTDTGAPYGFNYDTTTVPDGLYDLRVITTDNVGNVFTSPLVTNLRVDNTAPSTPSVSGGSLTWQSVASVGVTGSGATDSGSGISGYEYRTSTDGGSTWGSASAGATATVSAEGETVVQLRSVDNAGNTSAWTPVSPAAASTVRIDRTAATDPSVAGGSTSWQSLPSVTVQASGSSDGGSGFTGYQYRTSTDSGSTWSSPLTGATWAATSWVSPAAAAVDVPKVGVDAAGNAVAVWRQYDGANYLVTAATRPAGGSWGTPVALSAAGRDGNTPALAVAADGTAVALWARSDGTQVRTQAAHMSAAGTWGAAQDISSASSSALNPVVAVDASGDAVAAWEQNGIVSARYSSGAWGSPATVGTSGAVEASVAMNASGETVLAWKRSDGLNTRIETATRSGAGAWSAVTQLSAAGRDAAGAAATVSATGSMVVGWSRSDGSNTLIQTAERPGGGSWGAASTRSVAGGDANALTLASNDDGSVVAAWSRNDGSAYIVQAAERSAGGSWGATTSLSVTGAGTNAYSPRVATSAAGDAAVVWSRWNGSRYLIQASNRPSGGAWSTPDTLSDGISTAYQADAGMAPDGTLISVWQYSSTPSRIQSDVRSARAAVTVSAEGQTLVQLRSVDVAGNAGAWTPASAAAGNTVKLDRTAPVAPTVAGGSPAWTQSPATVTITGASSTDATSGVSGYQYRTSTDGGITWSASAAGASVGITATGETLVQYRSVDNAGNASAWTPTHSPTPGDEGTARITAQLGVDLATAANVHIRVDGQAADDGLGEMGVFNGGDINGDGIPDLIVGAPYADNNARSTSGSVYVIWGQSSPATIDLAALGGNGFRIDGAAANYNTGYGAGPAGDVNGDGLQDVLVGSHNAGLNGRSGSGSAYVVFGKASSTTVDLAALGTGGYRIDGAAANDSAGVRVATAGDVNGDGLADALISARLADNNTRADSGSVYIVFGKASTTTIDLAALGSGGYRVDGGGAGDWLGNWVANAGDVNGDGRTDAILGARLNDGPNGVDSGAAYVIFGKTSSTTVDAASLGSSGYRIDGAVAGDNAGWRVSGAGDVNGDGTPDQIISAPYAGNNNRVRSGSVYVVWGKSSTSAIDLNALGSGGYRIDGTAALDDAGGGAVFSVADINGDGIPEQIIGARGEGVRGRAASGAAYMVYGSSSTTTVDLRSATSRVLRFDGAAAGDALGGGATSMPDITGDGRPEVILSGWAVDGNGRSNSGSVYVVPLTVQTPSATTDVATGVATGLATLNGTVNPNGQATTWYIEWGATTAYGSQTVAASAGSGTSPVAVSKALTGLTYGQTIHYRVVATNVFDYTTYGADGVVTATDTDAPSAPTTVSGGSLSWQSVASVAVTASGGLDTGGSGLAGYEYRTSSDGGSTWSSSATAGATAVISEQGETVVQFRSVDGAGNRSSWTPASPAAGSTVRIDRTAPGVTAGSELVSGGDMETPSIGAGPLVAVAPSATGPWNLTAGSATGLGTAWQAADGVQSVELNGTGPGTFSQTLATTAGTTYRVQLKVAGDPDGGPAVKEMRVNWGGSTLRTVRFDTTGHSDLAMGWQTVTLEATASGASTLLEFESLTAGSYGPAIDAVSVLPQSGPTVSGGSLTWQSAASGTVTGAGATDAHSGLSGYEYRTSTDGGSTWSGATAGSSLTVSAEGETLVQYRAVDVAGNATAWTPASATAGSTVRLDRTTPTAPTVSGGSLSWQSVASVTVTASGSSGGASGLAGYEYRTSTDGGSTWSAGTAGSSVTVSAEGETLVEYRSLDNAGNASLWTPSPSTAGSTVRIDRTLPTTPTVSGGSLSWQSVASVTVTASGAAGGASGLSGYEYRTSTDNGSTWGTTTAGASVTVSAEGQTLVQYRALDTAGNASAWTPVSATAGSTVKIDRTAPSAPSASGGSLSWQSVASITLTASGATDADAGVSSHEYRTSTDGGTTWSSATAGSTLAVSAEGETLVQFRAVDGAGNTGAWGASGTARIDRTLPTAPTVSGGSLSWQSVASVDVTASGSAGGPSGLSGYEYRTSTDSGSTWGSATAGASVTVSAEGETLVQYRAIDTAGNASSWTPGSLAAGSTVRIDRTLPTAPTVSGGSLSWQSVASVDVTASGSAGGPSGLSGYEYRTSTDSGSTWGSATAGASVTISAEGETVVQYRSIDGAGNVSSWTPGSATAGSTVRINRTGPSAPAVAGGSLAWQSVPSITITGSGATVAGGTIAGYEHRTSTDGGSTWGTAAAGASVTISAEGETLAQFRAIDDAGNSGAWSPSSPAAGATARIDRTNPTAPSASGGSGGWQSVASITLTASGATDPLAGVASHEYRTSTDGGATWDPATAGASVTVSAEGETLVQFRAIDGAGNTGAWGASGTARIDRSDPSAPTVSGGSLSWQSVASVDVTASGSDGGDAGLSGYEHRTSTDGGSTWGGAASGASVTVSAEGETLVQYRAIDTAGNVSSWTPAPATAGSTVRIDRTDPTAPTVTGGSLSWQSVASVDVSASGSAGGDSGLAGYEARTSTDGGSTWDAPAPGATVTVVDEGETLVQFRSLDGAGNASPWTPSPATAGSTVRINRAGPGATNVTGGSLAWKSVPSVTVTGGGATVPGGTIDGYESRVSTDGGTTWSAPAAGASLTVSDEGETLVQFRAIDDAANAGPWSPSSPDAGSTVRIDRTDPTAPSAAGGSSAWQSVPDITLTADGATDPLAGVASHEFRTSTDAGSTWSAAAAGDTVVVSAEGETLVQFRAIDGAGNTGVWGASGIARIDRSAPTTAGATGGSLAWQSVASITLTATGSAGGDSGLPGYEYRTSTDGGSTWGSATPGDSVVVTDEGETLVQFRGVDGAGNAGPWGPPALTAGATARIDRTAPSDPAVAGGSLSWQSVPSVDVTGSGSDGGDSGLAGYEYRTSTDTGANWSAPSAGASLTVTDEGETLVQYRALDGAGNPSGWAPASPTAGSTVRIDRSDPGAPVVSGGSPSWQSVAGITLTGSGASGATSLESRISTDGGSTWSAPAAGSSVTVTDEGATFVQFRGVDDAGNVSGWSASGIARIDRTVPTDPTVAGGSASRQGVDAVTVTASGSAGGDSGLAGYEHRASVDSGSTWGAPASGASVTVTAAGETLVQFRSVDGAGNLSAWAPPHAGTPDPLGTVRLGPMALGPQRRVSVTGPDGDPSYDAVTPDVAHDSTHNQYLSVWTGDTGASGEDEVWGRLSSGSGEWIGAAVRLSDMGPEGDPAYTAWEPRVTYNAAADEYVVVWFGDDNAGALVDNEFEVYAQRVSSSGAEVGADDVRVSSMGPDGNASFDAWNPRIAYDPDTDEYMVTWEGDDNTGSLVDNEFEIFSQRLTATLGEVGTDDRRISDMGPDGNAAYDALRPDVAYDHVSGEYLVAWQGDDNTGPLVDNETEIFTQRLTATGAEVGPNDRRISDMGVDGNAAADAATPSIAVDRAAGGYAVAWSGDDPGGVTADDESEIFLQRLTSAGAETGANDVRVSSMGPDGDAAYDAYTPSLAWNAAARQYLVTWTGIDDGAGLAPSELEVYAQRVLSDGTPFGVDDERVSVMGPDGDASYGVGRASVASGTGSLTFLAVWDGSDSAGALVAGESEIHSRLLAIDPTAPTAPVVSGGSSSWQASASVTVSASGSADPESGVSGYESRVSTDGGATWSLPLPGASLAVTAEGETLVEFRGVNGNGDQGVWTGAIVRLDRTTPADPGASGGSAAWTSASSTTVTATGGAGGPSGTTWESRVSTDGGTTWSAPAAGSAVAVSDPGETLVQFRATDGAGNASGWAPAAGTAAATVRRDATAPTDPAVSGGSPAWQNVVSVDVTATGSTDAGGSGMAGYESRTSTDAGATWSAATPGASATITREGETLVQFRALDGAGNASAWAPAAGSAGLVRIDRGPPAAPANLTAPAATSGAPALTWDPVGDAVSYVVTRDGTVVGSPTGASFTDVTVPGEGVYTYRVSAVDGAGSQGSASSPVDVTVDTTAPPAPGDGGISGGSASWTNAASVTVTGTAPSGSTLEHRTSTDGGTTWSAPAAGASVTATAVGETLVQFRAVDAAGNASGWSPAAPIDAATVRIDRTPPGRPTGLTGGGVTTAQPVIGWTAVAGADRYRVLRDGVQVGSVTGTTFTDTTLTLGGTYVYRVIAVDAAGNASVPSSPLSVTFAPADVIPPNTSIGGVPAGPGSDATPTLTLAATEPSSFECSVDSGGWSPCASPLTLGPLADGTHALSVRARDAAGNLDPSPATATLVIDTVAPPVPSLTATADTGIPLGAATGRVYLAATGAGDAVRVVVTEGARTVYDGASVTSLPDVVADGVTHTYSVVGIDAAGNASAAVTASATTPDRTPPARPGAPNGSGYPLALTWTPVADATQYVVSREGTTAATVGTASATDPDALDAAAPPAPSGVSANVLGSGRVSLSWAAVTDAGTSYTMAVRAVDAIGNASAFSPGTPMIARSGIATYRVLLDGSPLVDSAGTAVDIDGLVAGSDHVLTVLAVDAAGNPSATSAPIAVHIPADPATAPRLRVTVSQAYVRPGDPVRFTAAVEGGTSGAVHWTLDSGVQLDGLQVEHTYATAGRRMVRATVAGTGGQTASSVVEVVVDATPPELDLVPGGSRLAVTGSDADSGVDHIEWSPAAGAPFQPLRDGSIPLREGRNRITIRIVDRAGNVHEVTRDLVGDTTAPTLALRVPLLVSGAKATVRVSLTDAGTGVAALEYGGRRMTRVPARLTVAAGARVTVTGIDVAGNRSTATFTVKRAPAAPKGTRLAWIAAEPRLKGAQRNLLTGLQMQLQAMKRLPAKMRPSDRYTRRIATAVTAYQRSVRMAPTGIVDGPTRARLARDLAKLVAVVTGSS